MSEIFAATPARTTADAVLELQRESESQHLERAGLIGLLATGFMAVALGALLLPAQRPLSLVALLSSIAALAVTSRVEVEFPGFVAIPTEAIFVVMWFVLPVRMLPLAVCAAMVLGRLPDVLRGRMPADRLGLTVAPVGQVVGSGSEGVVVTEVDPNGIASDQGFKTGDVILEVGGKKVANPVDVRSALSEAQKDGKRTILMRVKSGEETRFVAVRLAKA